MNEQSAKEWLIKAWHNLSGAKLFYEANHYSDVTACLILEIDKQEVMK